ncbi:MAG: glycosyltransferase [Ignisphaera sp.]
MIRNDKRIIIIADITDLWPESFTFMSKNFLVTLSMYLTRALNYIFYPKIDGLITHNKHYEVYIKNVYFIKKKDIPVVIIPHLVDLSFFRPMQKIEALLRVNKYFTKKETSIILNSFVIGYSGLISESIGSDLLIPITKEIINKNKQTSFLIVGEGPFKQKILSKIKGENLIIKGPFPYYLINYILNLFDLGVITSYYRERSPATLYWCPKKLGEYAACGKPIIYIGYSKPISSLIKEYNCGIIIEPESLDYLAEYFDKIKENYKNLSNGALKMAEMEFSLKSAKIKMEQFLARFSENI